MAKVKLLSKNKRFPSRIAVRQRVAQEGVGYFIKSYTSANRMPDQELANAFQKAKDALNTFEELLPKYDDWESLEDE